jgi:aminoglycoside phosphotransferase (APT) family kinase protein
MDYLMQWLPKNVPKEDKYCNTTIVHGDFRLDNVIFHKTEIRIIAVLDWELSTLGNPYADLASVGILYHLPPKNGLPGLGKYDKGFSGIPTEFKMRDEYAKNVGSEDISEEAWAFFLAMSSFKMGGIAQGVYKRSLMGNASSTKGPMYLEVCKFIAALGVRISK